MEQQNLSTVNVTFRLSNLPTSYPIAKFRPQDSPSGRPVYKSSGQLVDMRDLPLFINARFSLQSAHFVQKTGYVLLNFVFTEKKVIEPDMVLAALFEDLCQKSYWQSIIYLNPDSTSISCWGRTISVGDDNQPIMVWYKGLDGQKDLEAGKHPLEAPCKINLCLEGFQILE